MLSMVGNRVYVNTVVKSKLFKVCMIIYRSKAHLLSIKHFTVFKNDLHLITHN